VTVKTTAGPVGLARPKLRGTTGAFASRLFGAHVTKTHALESLVIASFVRGLAVRDVEAALAEALGEGRLAGAGFDVATIEPPPKDHVLMRLLEMPNFIPTPHVAWASREAIQSLADQLVDNVDAFVAGKPKNIVC